MIYNLMGTISDKLTYLAETKEALKDKLESIGIDTSTGDTFRDYVDKIDESFLFYAYANALIPFPYTNKKVNNYSMNVSPNIKIYAKTLSGNNYSSYSVEEWGDLVKSYTNNSSDIKNYWEPIGVEFLSGIEHFVIFFYLEDIDDYYPVPGCDKTGTTARTRLNNQGYNRYNTVNKYYGFRHSMYCYLPPNSTNYNGSGKLANPDGTTATITRDKNYFVLGSPNTHYKWRVKENCGYRIWQSEPEKDILRAEALYNTNEWMRHRASIVAKDVNGNDITTSIPDTSTYKQGTDEPDLYKVDIETVDGEMYFKIIVDENDSSKDILTNNLAKYNTHTFFSNYNPSSTSNPNNTGLLDQIYNDQKRIGINMNSGLDPNDPIKILTPGAKGAEAYVFQGKWRIITPILSICNTLDYSSDRNIPDSPMIYYWKHIIIPRFKAIGIDNVQMPNEKWIWLWSMNRGTPSSNYINSYCSTVNNLVSFLRNTAGGEYSYAVVPPTFNFTTWTSVRLTDTVAVASYLSYPNLSMSGCQSRLIPIFGVDLEPLAPPVITYDDNDTVTITAETGTEIYYTISNTSTPDIEPTLIEIMKGNTKIKKYTGPFKSNAQLRFTIRAISVKYKQKCSVESCEYFEVEVSGGD